MITAPVINLNGTSKDTLEREAREAIRAVDNAISAVSAMTVHGRDYQTAKPGLYEKARQEHEGRIKVLYQLKNDLEAIWLQIDEQA